MANPYGMTEFDAFGAINAMEAARSNRIRSMLLQRQIQREDAEAERQGGIQAALARYRGGGNASTQAAPSASAPPAPPTTLTPASAAPELMGGSDVSWAGATSSPALRRPGSTTGCSPRAAAAACGRG